MTATVENSTAIEPSSSILPAVVFHGDEAGGRLSVSEEAALNVILRRAGGEFQGRPFYKISWAALDNSGLAREHICGKLDPFDWANCYCPRRDALQTPLCFQESQNCYHLLAWEPLGESAVDKGPSGAYTCLLHFTDPKTGVPINVRASLLELVIPVLNQLTEIVRATVNRCDADRAIFRRESLTHIEEAERQRELAYNRYADAVLEDALPPFLNPFSSSFGKSRQFADLDLNEVLSRPRFETETPSGPSEFVFTARPVRPPDERNPIRP